MKTMMQTMMVLLVGGAVSGCSQTEPVYGNEICDYAETAVPWADEAPNGVVPGDVFDGLSTSATVTADEAPSDGEELSVMIERDGDDAFYLESDVCESRLELPLIFSVASVEGDALDEAFAVRAVVEGERVSIDYRFQPSELNGSYSPSPEASDATVLGLVLDADVGPAESEAKILVDIEHESGDAVANYLEVAWAWGW